ncbi:MAG: class E sortase [Acidimicrobiia bacterium]
MSDVIEIERNEDSDTRKPSILVRVIRTAGWTSIGLGLFLLGFVVHQLYVTTWFAQQNNDTLETEAVEHFETATITEVEYIDPVTQEPIVPPVSDDPSAPDQEPLRVLAEEPPEEGDPFAIIRIPSIERLQEGWTVVEGVRRSDLKNGAGHMPDTPLPGQPGNAVIAGHRTTYGAPFHEFDELVPGDIIEVETALGVHTYAVSETLIVRPTEVWVTDPREGAWLTLTTCHPKFSSRQRLVVFAELVEGPNAEVILAA